MCLPEGAAVITGKGCFGPQADEGVRVTVNIRKKLAAKTPSLPTCPSESRILGKIEVIPTQMSDICR